MVWCGTAQLRFAVKHASLLFDESLFFPDIYCSAKMSIANANERKYRKTASSMTLLACRKMERISRKGVLCMKTLSNSCLKSFQLKGHLNNAQNDQVSKLTA